MKREYFTTYESEPVVEEAAPTEIAKHHKNNDRGFPISFPFLKDKFLNLNLDDLLILVLVLIMLTEDEPDYITIIALAFIFFV